MKQKNRLHVGHQEGFRSLQDGLEALVNAGMSKSVQLCEAEAFLQNMKTKARAIHRRKF